MAIQTTAIEGTLPLPSGAALPAGSRAVFKLTSFDTDGDDVIIPSEVTASVSSGAINTQLWPNGRGTRGTRYQVTLYVGAGKSSIFDLGMVEVPSIGPVSFVTLILG